MEDMTMSIQAVGTRRTRQRAESRMWGIIFVLVTAAAVAAMPCSPARAQDKARLVALQIATAARVVVEGQNGIEVTFDQPSAERLRNFTRDAVGHHFAVFVDDRRLATLRLLDPIVDGNILLTGDLDKASSEMLFSPHAAVRLDLED
jgi:hypothetical protein